MLPNPQNYMIYPSVVRADIPCDMTIAPTERAYSLFSDVEYTIKIIGLNNDDCSFYYDPSPEALLSVKAEDGVIRFTYTFKKEQEFLIQLIRDGKVIGDLHLYSLYEDLYRLTPLRGDFHSHSYRSDGKRDPAALAGHFREQGYDFFALTDHNRHFAGGEIDEVYDGIKLGITRVLGEELHPPVSTIHIVHVGCKDSVTAEYIHNRENYEKEKAEYLTRVPSEIPEAYRERYAMTMWATDRVHAGGGLAIFPHPFWIPKSSKAFNVCDELAKIMLKSGMFDAYELIGCMHPAGTNLSVALWETLRAEGYDIPIVGSSDVHGIIGSPSFPHHFTICFAESNTNDAIVNSIREKMTVAVEGVGEEYDRRYYTFGDMRLVSYAQFLLAYYFPERERSCAGEGVAMRAYAMGAAPASLVEEMAKMNRDASDRFFGRAPALVPSREILDFEEKWREVQIKQGPITCSSSIDSKTITRNL